MLLPVSDDAAIFLVQESAVALSTRMRILGRGGCAVLGSQIGSRTVLQNSMIVTNSKIQIDLIYVPSAQF